ncbi:MAG TPA: alpha-amylase family glycosyl hydrolase [Opitutaceae bacterium]|jgi:glycosidase/predicted alpha/beta superfamily hydrolase
MNCRWLLALAAAVCARAEIPAISLPAYEHPGAGQVFYFVLTDRFANGDPANDQGGLTGGPDKTGFDPANQGYFHGGDLKGLTEHLDYIQRLGASAIWITPPFRNQVVQLGSAGYHGYWILDFMNVDPHLGTNADLRDFIAAAHARGIRVYLDIVVNHTADVIHYQDGRTDYVDLAHAPYRNSSGHPFDVQEAAYNGLGPVDAFPSLSAERSFPHPPIVDPDMAAAKNPAWLNDLTLYHNRGNSHFRGENALYGDFVGLDDLFTEQPRVVRGFIDVYRHWLEDFGIDGYRIDTVKHVNQEFWQAFAPALHARARELGRPDFLMFGEVSHDIIDGEFSSAFASAGTLDAVLDFGFFGAAQKYLSQHQGPAELRRLFEQDDYFTGPDRSAGSLTTFISNHDAGRFGFFVSRDNPGASPGERFRLAQLADGLLALSRGQPVFYYGDEQGMTGFGDDRAAREDMFPSQTPQYRALHLLGSTRTGADDKFDECQPLFRLTSDLARLRLAHPGLSTGATFVRPTDGDDLFAFSRLEHSELVEYLVAFNASRTDRRSARLPTAQPAGVTLLPLYSNDRLPPALEADARGRVEIALAPLQFAVWEASQPLARPPAGLSVHFVAPASGATLEFTTRTVDGQPIASRAEFRADTDGGDGVAEVTFALRRASRPGQVEILGTATRAPYRVYWHPPADWPPGEIATFVATANDLRGHCASAEVDDVAVAPNHIEFGIRGARVPTFLSHPDSKYSPAVGSPIHWSAPATGTPPLVYQWYQDGIAIPWATGANLDFGRALPDLSGHYVVTVSDREGTIASPEIDLEVAGRPAAAVGRLDSYPAFSSQWLPPRQVDVWVPPGYDDHASQRYPVLYMEDGQNLFDARYSLAGVAWRADQAVASLMAKGLTRGAIVVAIWNSGLTRVADDMPQRAATSPWIDRIPSEFQLPHVAIRSDRYLRFLATELKPWVDAHYRTLPDRSHTFAAGSSLGGLISADALIEYPAVFGGAACLSTHWTIDRGSAANYVAAHLSAGSDQRWYFDRGTLTLDANYGPFQAQVDAAAHAAGFRDGVDWDSRVFPGDDHSETAWARRLQIPLQFLLSP